MVLSELDGVCKLKEEQRAALKASLGGKDVFALLLTRGRLIGRPINRANFLGILTEFASSDA